MGSDLVTEFAAARKVYERASEVVGYDMQELCFNDPRDELDKTRFTQPALLTHEYACLEAFRSLVDGAVGPNLAAGHSLGEYSALVSAGALTFEAALELVSERGRLMSQLGHGSMLATTLNLQSAQALADKHYCEIGGCNLPEQTVIAGADRDLDTLTEDLNETYPKKRAVRLNTEGAFHTFLMVSAAEQFRPVLEKTVFQDLGVDVLSNYTGKLHVSDSAAIRSRLFFQLFNPVRWITCMNNAVEAGINTIVEFGGGIGRGEGPGEKRANLEGIVKKALKWQQHDAQYLAAINCPGIHAAAKQLIDS